MYDNDIMKQKHIWFIVLFVRMYFVIVVEETYTIYIDAFFYFFLFSKEIEKLLVHINTLINLNGSNALVFNEAFADEPIL